MNFSKLKTFMVLLVCFFLIIFIFPVTGCLSSEKSKAEKNGETVFQKELFFIKEQGGRIQEEIRSCLLYTSPSPRDVEESRMPSSA